MNQALAHDQSYPHIHPHPQVSIAEDVLYGLLFAILIGFIVYKSLCFFKNRSWIRFRKKD